MQSISMDSKDLLLTSLEKRGETYLEKLKTCREEFSEKSIHDVRTSIRRLLALLDVVGFVTAASRAEKLSDRLKDQLDGLDDLRDIHVMLEEVSNAIQDLPELEPFRDHLEKREKSKQRSTQEHVQEIKPNAINKRLNKLCDAVDGLLPEEVRGKLPQAVDEAYLTVVQRYGEVDPARLDSIHRLRVAFKKFRYMMESIHPALPHFPESELERMHAYQTQMGNIHDVQVLVETLKEFGENSDSYDPQSVRRVYERRLAEMVSAYLKDKDQVLHFWRANPLAAFPWEDESAKKEQGL